MIKIVAKIAGLLIFVVCLGLFLVMTGMIPQKWLDRFQPQNTLLQEIVSQSGSTNEDTPTTNPEVSVSPRPSASAAPEINYFRTYTNVNDLKLNQLRPQSLVYVNKEATLAILSNGESGKYLRSTGSESLPEWVDMNQTVTNNNSYVTNNSGLSSPLTELALAGAAIPLKVGTDAPFQILNTGRVEVSYVGDSGYLSSSGGAIFINNTQNVGTALGIYSDGGADALGNMINVKVDNPNYAQAAFYMNYDGSSNAVEIVSNSVDSSSNALAVTNNNISDSALGIIGYELAKGTIKVSHYRPGSGNDSSASGLSIDLKGSGTRAQGVYVDSTETGGTLGNLLRLRNESVDKFVVNYQGNLNMAGSQTIGANGTDTTLTKYGNAVGDEFFVGTNASFRIQRAASNSEAFRTQIAGDTNGRWVGTSDGRLRWGDGTNASDVTLRRGSTGILWVEGGITINNNNGDFNTVVKGVADSNLLYIDASDDRIGIGTSVPGSRLHVTAGDILLENTYALRIKDSAGSARPVLSYTSGNNVQLYNYATGGIVQIGLNNVSNTAGNIRFFTNNNVERMRIDPAGVGIGATAFGTSAQNVLAIASSTAPTTSIVDGIQLFAVDEAGSHELRVRDEATNVTTLSPHNFSNIPDGPSEELAWAFFSERNGKSINVDMTRALRIVEQLSGEQLIYLKDSQTGEYQPVTPSPSLEVEKMTWVRQFVSRQELAFLVEWTEASWTFLQAVEFKAQATFRSAVAFLGDVTFFGALTVNQDTAGSITLPVGTTELQVVFTKPYTQVPLVYLTPTTVSRPGYSIAEVTTTAFTIRLDQAWPEDTSFNWLALVKNGANNQTQVLKTGPLPQISPVPTQTPTVASPTLEPSSSPVPLLTPTPVANPSPESVVLGETDTSPEPSSEPSPSLEPIASDSASSAIDGE